MRPWASPGDGDASLTPQGYAAELRTRAAPARGFYLRPLRVTPVPLPPPSAAPTSASGATAATAAKATASASASAGGRTAKTTGTSSGPKKGQPQGGQSGGSGLNVPKEVKDFFNKL